MPLRRVAEALDRMELRGSRVLVAASGGIDSTVLLHVLLRLARRHELALCVGHVDHGLREGAAAADARFVAALAAGLELPVGVERVDPGALREGHPSRTRPTVQEAARQLRYPALGRLAERFAADVIATGHNADDQAETVLMRVLRGSGLDGLGGIPERARHGHIVRPMLRVPRGAITRYALEHGLKWREDASNRSHSYTRNRIRAHWLPGLVKDFNPQLLRTLGDLAETCRTDAEWIETIVAEEAQSRFRSSEEGLEIAREGWNELPEALSRRLARRALVEMGAGRELSRMHVTRVVEFLRAPASAACGRALELPTGLRLERRPRSCLLRRNPVAPGAAC